MIAFQFIGILVSIIGIGSIVYFTIYSFSTDKEEVEFMMYFVLLIVVAVVLATFIMEPSNYGYMRITEG